MPRRALNSLLIAVLLTPSLACALGGDIEWMPEQPSRPNVSLRVDFEREQARVISQDTRDFDLRAWRIRCGSRSFIFPGVTLAARETITVTNGLTGCHNPPRYLRWDSPNIWTWPDEDCQADLLDAAGIVVARGGSTR
jgi:hypothetical protein